MTNVQDYLSSLNAAIDSRAAYEVAKNADNNSIQSVLAALRKDFNRAEVIAQIMIDNSVNAEFIKGFPTRYLRARNVAEIEEHAKLYEGSPVGA